MLWSYEAQAFKAFEIVIADDGSKQPTFDVLERLRKDLSYTIIHVWQEDQGFQKSQILNKAILKMASDYLIFTDGDCIPRNDFVETHLKLRKPKTFLSGGYFKLPQQISNAISKEDIEKYNCFHLNWLLERGLKKYLKRIS
ncbi:glycosyltransferase [Formosa sp. S-31]|uniref:glycosyltransferase n=1 Tax=Formosa sp. S-31 TaxID=2790949 RepID=UPI003EB81653